MDCKNKYIIKDMNPVINKENIARVTQKPTIATGISAKNINIFIPQLYTL